MDDCWARAAGAQVVVAARRVERLDALAADLPNSMVVACDVAVDADLERLTAATLERYGRIDILVNNAGINIRKPPHTLDIEEWDRVIKTNLTSAFLCSQAVGHEGRGRRQDHQYRLDDVDFRRQLRAGLCCKQGRHRAVHALLRDRLGRR